MDIGNNVRDDNAKTGQDLTLLPDPKPIHPTTTERTCLAAISLQAFGLESRQMAAFAIIPSSVFTDTSLSPAEFRVLGALFSFRSGADDWHVWPSRTKIAERAGIKAIDHVSHITKRLEDYGWIKRERRRGSSIYRLFSGPECQSSCLDLSTPAQIDQTQMDQTQHSLPSPLQVAQVAPVPSKVVDKVERRQRKEKQKVSCSDAARRILSLFKSTCGVEYPTEGAIAQKVDQAVLEHGEEKLTKVIQAKGPSFRFPLALLKPEIVESISAELSRPRQAEGTAESVQPVGVKEKRIYGIPVSVIEKNARPGESLEDAALRLYESKRAA